MATCTRSIKRLSNISKKLKNNKNNHGEVFNLVQKIFKIKE